jgi:hypothetical protein
MRQRDGVTAVTATRYPPGRRKKEEGWGRHGRARRGPVARARHAVTPSFVRRGSTGRGPRSVASDNNCARFRGVFSFCF